MHEAYANTDSGEGKIYATLSSQAKRLFQRVEPMTPRSQWNNLAVAPRPTFILIMLYVRKNLSLGKAFFFQRFVGIWGVTGHTWVEFLIERMNLALVGLLQRQGNPS